MRAVLGRILDWVDDRTQFVTVVKNILYEDIPASSGWHQVFGSVALFLFLVEAFTGVLLAFNYAPQPNDAYYSLQYIISQVTAGRLIRGLHHWGASLMVVVVVLHMLQVALWGAYKKPREATWILGVFLLLLVLGFGFTGYLLPWDNRAYWATVVAVELAKLTPMVGDYLAQLLGSSHGVGVATFSRFYTLHVVIFPALTALLMVLHVYLVRKHGITPHPEDGNNPKKKFYPGQAFKDLMAIFTVFVILFVLALAIEVPLEQLADPTDSSYVPRPEWYFLFFFQILKFFDGSLEVFGAIILPTLAIIALMAVPFLDRGQVKRLRERTIAFGIVGVALTGWVSLTAAAVMTTPRQVRSLETIPPGVASWTYLTPAEVAGRAYYQREKCSSCHNLSEGDPKIGPTLATSSHHKSSEWLLEHFNNSSDIVPGRIMPAVAIPDVELNCLAAFLRKLSADNARALEAIPSYALRGALIYQQNQCSSCHKVNGAGEQQGPSLNGLAQRRTTKWMIDHLRNPQIFNSKSIMPAYDFPKVEMDAIVAYLNALP